MPAWKCNRRLWKTDDGLIVEEGDPRARRLYAIPGTVLQQRPKVEKLPGAKAVTPKEDKQLSIDEVEDK